MGNNSGYTVGSKNLRSWQPGVSGNPKGRPKGSRNVKKVIQDLLNDEDVYKMLPLRTPGGPRTPLEAILRTLVVKAIRGDVRASEVLLKYSVDRDEPGEVPFGLFDGRQKRIVFEDIDNRVDSKAPIVDKSAKEVVTNASKPTK